MEAKTIEIREWLTVHLPHWREFKIAAAHAYLSPLVGPEAAEISWDKAIKKYWDRVCLIAGSGSSSYYSILAYNTYAVSCLEYLCQL